MIRMDFGCIRKNILWFFLCRGRSGKSRNYYGKKDNTSQGIFNICHFTLFQSLCLFFRMEII